MCAIPPSLSTPSHTYTYIYYFQAAPTPKEQPTPKESPSELSGSSKTKDPSEPKDQQVEKGLSTPPPPSGQDKQGRASHSEEEGRGKKDVKEDKGKSATPPKKSEGAASAPPRAPGSRNETRVRCLVFSMVSIC